MLQEELGKWFRKLFVRGVNSDVEKDMLPEGFGTMLQNMRVTSVEGNTGSAETIGGEELLYADAEPGYKCIGTFATSEHVGSFHAPFSGGAVKMKIDGDTVLESPIIPYRWDKDLQICVVDRKQGPIVFPADGESDPLFFDINRILDAFASGSQEFFSALNLQAISVLAAGPDEWPEHIDLPEVGDGLQPGQYNYSLRLVFATGDRSNPGPPTPNITVPGIQAPVYWPPSTVPNDPGEAFGNRQYPGGQTVGAEASIDLDTPTRYGITLRFVIENINAASRVEIVRQKFVGGAGINGPGVVEVVGSLELIPGARQEFVWTDPVNAILVEEIPTDVAVREILNFTGPKTVEHVDNRVVYANIKLKDRTPAFEYREVNGLRMFPITSKVATKYDGLQYNDGFSDPVNNTYLKGAMHLEKYGIGILSWDANGAKSTVSEVGEISMPARAERKAGDSLFYSTDPIYRANTECQGNDPVSPTFDAIVQGSVGKISNGGGFTNVHSGGPGNPLNYNPWAPKGPADPNFVRYRVGPVSQRNLDGTNNAFNQGFCFSPEIHSLGVGIYGPQNVQQAAPYTKVLSVMRTDPAGAVVAEGIGCYVLEDDWSLNKKRQEIDVFFPDMNDSLVSLSLQDDISANPSNYAVRVTPYGFYTEEYSYYRFGPSGQTSNGSGAFDMISYANIQRDNGTVNVGDSAPQGFQPGASAPPSVNNNVGYSAWRGQPNPSSIFNTSPQQGAYEFPIAAFDRLVEGRGTKWRIRSNDPFYHTQGSGEHFNQAATRNFHEGLYVVSIIRKGAQLSTANIQRYKFTGQHIAMERCVGVSQGAEEQFELFHARLYDCFGRTPQDDRYIYIQEQGQEEKRWICATGNDIVQANIAQILADIAANGFWVGPDGQPVHGLYSAFTDDSGVRPINYISLGGFGNAPEGARVVVKYDKREPILSHGFDCTVAPAVFAPVDRFFAVNDWLIGNQSGAVGAALRNRAPLPYSGGVRNSDYLLPSVNITLNQPSPANLFVNTPLDFGQGIRRCIRQWVIMSHLVTRSPQHMLVAGDRGVFPFPRTHYVIRPAYIWSTADAAANGFSSSYDLDYPGEAAFFRFGGFRFWSNANLDYSKQPLDQGVGAPRNGVQRSNILPCTYVASERLDPLAADLPGLRTFYEDNLFSVSEENGEVKFIAALDQGSMQQLYGWNERGMHMIPYNKSILTGADGEAIGSQSISNFWPREEVWRTRNAKGMPEEMWKIAVKAHGPVGDTTMDTVLWADKQGAYQLVGGRAVDISRGKFTSTVLPELQQVYSGSSRAASMFNPKNGEWWMMTPPRAGGPSGDQDGGLFRPRPNVFVFSLVNREWVGRFTYDFDKFLNKDNELYGMLGLQTYELDKGFNIRGVVREAYAETFIAPYTARQSELVAWRVHPDKPDELRVYDKDGNIMLIANEAIQEAFEPGTGEFWVMQVDAWQAMMNCVSEAYAAQFGVDRQPPQSTGYYLRIYFKRPEKQRITFLEAQARMIP